jgi:hypothetical protein
MHTFRPSLPAALLVSFFLLAACGDRDPAPSATPSAPQAATAEPKTMIGRAAKKGIDQAREKLRTENISITNGFDVRGSQRGISIGSNDDNASGKPGAELTPSGDLLIEGRKVSVDASQQALLKRYRGQIEQVAFAGMDIGVQGADLAGKAMSEAFAGLLGGDTQQLERRMEAEGQRIEASARKLCEQLPALYDTQQALAASLPEFKPYATMEQKDIDECFEDKDPRGPATRAQVRDEIRQEIRNGIRETVQSAARGEGFAADNTQADAAADAEAASVEDSATR